MDNKRFVFPSILFAIGLSLCLLNSGSAQMAGSAIETPVDDATFEQILEFFEYDKDLPLDPKVFDKWPWRGPQVITKVSYRSVRGERVPAYLAVPKDYKEGSKLPAIVLMHGWNLFWGKNEDWVQAWMTILTSNGYVVLAPDHFNFGERRSEDTSESDYGFGPYTKRDWMAQTVVDLRRGIDYLQQRPEVDSERIAVFGGSMGGWIGSVLAAVEPRIKTTVLTVPATDFGTEQTAPGMVVNSSNFFPRISSPLMVVMALQDSEKRNARMQELIKLVRGKKRFIEYDEQHFLPPDKYNEDILRWLKENL
jgi:dienelactone hydrolase